MTTTRAAVGAERVAGASSLHLYYPWFDWLRAVLAVTVMFGHERLIGWSNSGEFAVKVFFALSGWLIGNLLLETSRAQLQCFYFNRAVRIWAPYYLALALLLGVSLLRDPVTGKWLEIVFYKLTFVYNWFGVPQLTANVQGMPLQGTGNHFWSVNAEEQFYLLAPLLLVLASPRIGRAVSLWILLSLAAWWFGQYASIVWGVTAALASSKWPDVFARRAVRAAMLTIAVACSAGIAAGLDYELLAPPVSICIVLLLAVPGTRTKIGTIVGGMSYPFYLNHWIGIFVAHAVFKPLGMRDSWVVHLLSLIVNIVLAFILYWNVDRRLLASRPKTYTPERARWATRTAYTMVGLGLAGGFLFLNFPDHA